MVGQCCRTETLSRSCLRAPSLNFFADVSFPRPGGRTRRGGNRGSRPTLTQTLFCAPAEAKNATGQITGVSLPRQHLVRVFRAPRFFLLPVCQSRRTNNGGDSAKRVFSLPKRSIPDSENRGDLAEIATSLNRIATIDRRSALRKKCNRADNGRHWVRAFRASRRYFPVSAVNYAEGITEATLPTWQPVEMFLPLLVFCLRAWSLPLEK